MANNNNITITTNTFPSAEAFLFHYLEHKDYDILLLDIEMKQTSGIDLAKIVRKENESVQIVFITGYSDYISIGYDVAALHYLIKPVNDHKFYEVLDRAIAKVQKNERFLLLEESDKVIRIPYMEICYLEVHKNYVTIHAKQEYTTKRTLSEFEKELDEQFYRLGRSYLLNLNHIQQITKKEITLTDGTIIPLPRGHYQTLNKAIITQL